MTTLIIARHGNTFGVNDTPTRVGKHTDLPLVETGITQAKAMGRYLKQHDLIPDVVYSSTLQRTRQTAEHALKEAAITLPVYALDIFDEIDYGVDENQTEDTVIARIGQDAITAWDQSAIVPDGWQINPQEVIQNWHNFADRIIQTQDTVTQETLDIDETVLVVTSNGIARFAPYITGDFKGFADKHPLKLSTGAIGILRYDGAAWRVMAWNEKPII